jgi:small GTP-binding protein
MATVSKKICLVGDFGVGKTSLIRRFVDRQFSDQYLSTIGVKISRKTVELHRDGLQEKTALQLLIWDIEGHTKFKSISPNYLQGAKGGIIVGDITRQETLTRLPEHVQTFLSVNPEGKIVVAFNKSDLADVQKLELLFQQIQFQDQKNVVAIYASSAKTGENVDEIFDLLAQHLIA